jgi:hypothetical protein
VLLFVAFLRSSLESHAHWSALVLELCNQLDKYVTSWELLAVAADDAHQLLAAINQVQQLLDAALASFAGLSLSGGCGSSGSSASALASERAHALAALDFAVQTMDFLHLAHRNLISELGSTQPIMRLVASLGAVRTKLMHVRSKLPAPAPGIIAGATGAAAASGKLVGGKLVVPAAAGASSVGSSSASSPSSASVSSFSPLVANLSPTVALVVGLTCLNVLLLLCSPPLSTPALNVLLPLGLVMLLCGLMLLVWGAQFPFQASSHGGAGGGVAVHARFPHNVLAAAGISMLVSLEPLYYLRARLAEKEVETQQRVQQADEEEQQQQAHHEQAHPQQQQPRLAAAMTGAHDEEDD